MSLILRSVRITFLLVLGRLLSHPHTIHKVGAFTSSASVTQLRQVVAASHRHYFAPTIGCLFGEKKLDYHSWTEQRIVLRVTNSEDMDENIDNQRIGDMKVIGVMGGIGSGKSTACQLLVSEIDSCKERIDADKIAHEVYLPGSPVLTEITEEFGDSLVLPDTGELNRKALGQIVFGNPQAMSKLEHIVWPHVRNLIKERIKSLQQTFPKKDDAVVILEAAVLLDAGWEDLCDAIWVVRTSHDVAMERLVQYRGMNEDDAASRIKAQQSRRGIGNLDIEYESGQIQAIIENSGTQEELIQALKETFINPSSWKQLAE